MIAKLKNVIQLLAFITLILMSCKREDAFTTDNNIISIVPKIDHSDLNKFLPTSNYNQIIIHQFYTLSYAEKYEQAEWVAYRLEADFKVNTHYKRPYFIEDNLVKTKSADWRNYRKSGYDKGHLCPAGDMKFSEKAFTETFYTSNISPQKHDFNSGIWNTLEQKVRYWSQKYNGIYVITGPVLTDGLQTIGSEQVAIPKYFYKVLLNTSASPPKMIAFLVPGVDSNKPLYKFVVAVDSLEKITNIDFFSSLPDNLENALEQGKNYKNWSF